MFLSRRLSQRPTAEELEQRNILKRERLKLTFTSSVCGIQRAKCFKMFLMVLFLLVYNNLNPYFGASLLYPQSEILHGYVSTVFRGGGDEVHLGGFIAPR